MHTAYSTPVIRLTDRRLADIEADLLVLPAFGDEDWSDEPDLDDATSGEVGRALARGEFRGGPFDVLTMASAFTGWKTPRVMLVGAGRRADVTAEVVRRLATTGALAARQRRLERVAIAWRTGTPLANELVAQVIAEGAVLANFEGSSWKTDGPPVCWISNVEVRLAGTSESIMQSIERGRTLGECTNQARSLSNAPGNDLTPRGFAERARSIAEAAGLGVEVLGEEEITRLGMGLLLGVARGSAEPPQLVVLRHDPAGAPAAPVLGLVGKGITFDTGGISIKPADNMDKMKDDMSGGAAVVCAMAAIARLRLPVRCIGVVPMTENMPGGRAVKPGDVLRSASGKTVEILNTDAEGRLVLGDAVWYAREQGATHLVDVATLTGACVVALGKTTSGLFGVPAVWVEHVRRASERAGDRSWPMPVFDDYREQLKSEIADFTNTGGRAGGAITGALFIKEFAGALPWVHMDIAGTAWAEEAKPYQPKGATGVAVRTLVELARDAPSWSGVGRS